MNLDHSIHQLETLDGNGKLWKRTQFARSLISQYNQRGSLSPKQEEWVNIIITENLEAPTAIKPTVTGLTRVIEIFDAAAEKLKYPKLVVQFADGSDFKLSRAGSKSKHNGCVQLTDGGPFGSNKYFGRITREGELVLHRDGKVREVELTSIMKSMTTDLGTFAKMYGHKSGNCCFCNTPIGEGNDQRSVDAGYGPVCADNYGLPWGEKE